MGLEELMKADTEACDECGSEKAKRNIRDGKCGECRWGK